jgi:hypothetical protein
MLNDQSHLIFLFYLMISANQGNFILIKQCLHYCSLPAKTSAVISLEYTNLTYLGHIPQIEMILVLLRHPRYPMKVGVA